jgi:hypothetical protein
MRDVQLRRISLRIHFIGALTHALRQQTRQLEDSRLFFLHNRSLSTMILLSVWQSLPTRLLSRIVHDFSYVATKKLLSAKGKGDRPAPIIKSAEQLFDGRTVRNPDRRAAGDGRAQVVVR